MVSSLPEVAVATLWLRHCQFALQLWFSIANVNVFLWSNNHSTMFCERIKMEAKRRDIYLSLLFTVCLQFYHH